MAIFADMEMPGLDPSTWKPDDPAFGWTLALFEHFGSVKRLFKAVARQLAGARRDDRATRGAGKGRALATQRDAPPRSLPASDRRPVPGGDVHRLHGLVDARRERASAGGGGRPRLSLARPARRRERPGAGSRAAQVALGPGDSGPGLQCGVDDDGRGPSAWRRRRRRYSEALGQARCIRGDRRDFVRGHRAATAALATLLLAACGSATQVPTSSTTASASAPATAIASPAPSSPIAAVSTATPHMTPKPTPRPSPTSLAVPPPPSKGTFKITYPSATRNRMTVTWAGPRSKGIEDPGLWRHRMHRDATVPGGGSGRAMSRRAHAPARVGPQAHREGTRVDRQGQLDMAELGEHRVLRGDEPRRNGVRSDRHRRLQRRGPLEVHHRQPRVLVRRLHLLAGHVV